MKAQVKVGRKNGRSAELVYAPTEGADGTPVRGWAVELRDAKGHVARRIEMSAANGLDRAAALTLLTAAGPWLTGDDR